MPHTRPAASRADYWRGIIAEHERSGISVRAFCEQRRIGEPSFYYWRRHLLRQAEVRFALVETGPVQTQEPLELILPTGERLCIKGGVDITTLRTVLEALRT